MGLASRITDDLGMHVTQAAPTDAPAGVDKGVDPAVVADRATPDAAPLDTVVRQRPARGVRPRTHTDAPATLTAPRPTSPRASDKAGRGDGPTATRPGAKADLQRAAGRASAEAEPHVTGPPRPRGRQVAGAAGGRRRKADAVATQRSAQWRTCRSPNAPCLAVAVQADPSANRHMARARLASPTGVCCFRSHPVKVARVWSSLSRWIAEWRPCISPPEPMSCRREKTSATTLPVFPPLFKGDLYLGADVRSLNGFSLTFMCPLPPM